MITYASANLEQLLYIPLALSSDSPLLNKYQYFGEEEEQILTSFKMQFSYR